MTALDIFVLLLIGGGAVLGLVRGFVTEILSLFAWGAAMFALKLLHTPATHALTGFTHSEGGAAVLAFLLVFGVTFFLGKMIAASLGRRTRQSVLGPVDRLLGLGFGGLKGLLVATVLFLGINLAYDTVFGGTSARPQWLRTARTYPLLNASGRAVVDFVHRRRGDPVPQSGFGNESAPAG
ncbi:CvpA family protein [Sphingomonas nostoxanthinifaciens]|uniref:CvpA family protein n=1 Tax=Sphingomonas nostoxanthinifaciens TaxID=2872652 RepID=UPI001CC2159A|nr:CvpA family protein [Sphingomonas nostoxanthinifaciens]UAK26641.1 CvpA family protein [Sphingomonas nostoxanthinifaciens]